jgi:hypothetical protein
MTAIELYYSSVEITKPYYAGDDYEEEQYEPSEIEKEAMLEYYLNEQKPSFNQDFSDF